MSERIVVVGFGPVAARLVDELLPAVRSGLAHLTVVGEESEAAYNRVLVADLGVGRTTPAALALVRRGRAGRRRRGRPAGRPRPARGPRPPAGHASATAPPPSYDRLVFATGSRPGDPQPHRAQPGPGRPGAARRA